MGDQSIGQAESGGLRENGRPGRLRTSVPRGPGSANRPGCHNRRSTRRLPGLYCLPGSGFPGSSRPPSTMEAACVIASRNPTRTAAAEPAGRAAFHAFLAGVRFQRSDLDWLPEYARPVASPARGRPPTAAESAGPTRRPAARHNRRICAQTTGQSMQSAQANSRRYVRIWQLKACATCHGRWRAYPSRQNGRQSAEIVTQG
jgi:hypothetical protein